MATAYRKVHHVSDTKFYYERRGSINRHLAVCRMPHLAWETTFDSKFLTWIFSLIERAKVFIRTQFVKITENLITAYREEPKLSLQALINLLSLKYE